MKGYFSREQLDEQEQFKRQLREGKANIVFSGNFERGREYLRNISKEALDAKLKAREEAKL